MSLLTICLYLLRASYHRQDLQKKISLVFTLGLYAADFILLTEALEQNDSQNASCQSVLWGLFN